MKQALSTLAVLILIIVTGCTLQFQPTNPPEDNATLRINSTHATTPLMDTAITAYLDLNPDTSFVHQSANYASNLAQLQNGDIAYFTSSHLTQPNNVQIWAAPLAQDGLAIITHRNNPVSEISVEELRRIYRGFITNWSEIGGDDIEIIILSREEGSGTRAEFDRLVMGNQRTSPNAQLVPSAMIAMQQVAAQDGAIAYLPASQVTAGVQILSVEEVSPSRETIAASRYPLRYTIYLIGLTEPENLYRNFVGWMQGKEGQTAIQSRYAPLP